MAGLTATHAPRFSGFRADDRASFVTPPPPKPIIGLTPVFNKPPRPPIQVEIGDRQLLKGLEEEAKQGRDSGRFCRLEWKLKARLMQLNHWATGQQPWPGETVLTRSLNRVRIRHQAKHLLRNVARSSVYTPSPWLVDHFAWMAKHYRLNALRYFKQP